MMNMNWVKEPICNNNREVWATGFCFLTVQKRLDGNWEFYFGLDQSYVPAYWQGKFETISLAKQAALDCALIFLSEYRKAMAEEARAFGEDLAKDLAEQA